MGVGHLKGAPRLQSRDFRIDGATCLEFVFDPLLDKAQVDAMAETVETAIARGGDLRLLLDLSATQAFAVGAFVSPKGFITSLRSVGPVSRYATVGAPEIAAAAVESFGAILPLEARAFPADAIDEARRWVAGAEGV